MAQPVWVLSVDLQAKTATFQTGLAEAARSARYSFSEIGSASGEASAAVGKHSTDVRHSLGLVDNVLRGDHMRAFVDLIRIYSQSSIVMAALPFAAVAGGLALIGGSAYAVYEHFHKLAEEQEKLNNAFTELDTSGNKAFRQIDDEILKAQQRADELSNNHLAALQIQLTLIDHQTMNDLVKALDDVQKAADGTFKSLRGHWYTFGSGAAGASHALEQFRIQYDSLMESGNSGGASNLLHGTLESAQRILQLQKSVTGNRGGTGMFGADLKDAEAYYSAQAQLRQAGVGYTKSEVAAQEALVSSLEKQVGIETRLNALKHDDKGNATRETGNAASAQRSAAARAAAQAQLSMGTSALAGEKAAADAQAEIHQASLEARLAIDLDFAEREEQVKLAANQAEIAALDKSGKDYQNQLKGLNDKSLEIEQDYQTAVAELKSKAAVEINQRDTTALEQAIREQIDATQQGTSARLAAVDAGLREEQAHNLQATQFYRDLLTQRVGIVRQMGEEEAKQKAEAGREAAENEEKMEMLELESLRQSLELYNSAHRVSAAQRIQEEIALSAREHEIKMQALQSQVAALDKSDRDYLNKLKTLQNQETQLVRQHENDITAIKQKAEEQQNAGTAEAYKKLVDMTSQSLTQSIMRHQTWAQTLTSLSNQVISSMLENAIKSALMDDFDRERDAAKAARKFFLAGAQLPFPANIVAAPALAAGAFASVMAFETGTDAVPGVGRGDIVPTMLAPGEGVVPGGVMDGLRNVARNGGFEQQPGVTIHVRPTYHVQTIDGDGMQKVLSKHSDEIQRHVSAAIRKTNSQK